MALFTMIVRDYLLGERWKAGGEAPGKPGVANLLNWLFGLTGLFSFISGMFCLAYVATNIIGYA